MYACLKCTSEIGSEYTSGEGSSSCDRCKRGYYMTGNGACVDCSDMLEDSTKEETGVDCSEAGNNLGES